MSHNRQKKRSAGVAYEDISLMTLLAGDATAEARKLLQKYNREDAKSYADLEQKLAELYQAAPDKIELEKKMAAIHPHRKWLLKYIEPNIKEVVVEVPAPAPAAVVAETKSNADGQGNTLSLSPQVIKMTPLEYVAIISVVGLIGLTYYAISKT